MYMKSEIIEDTQFNSIDKNYTEAMILREHLAIILKYSVKFYYLGLRIALYKNRTFVLKVKVSRNTTLV